MIRARPAGWRARPRRPDRSPRAQARHPATERRSGCFPAGPARPRSRELGDRAPVLQRRGVGRDRPDARPRHRLLRLRPAVLALPLGLGVTTLIVVGILTLGTYAARRAALAVPPDRRRCARTCRSSARCCWSSSPPATSSTSPSWRTRRAGTDGSVQAALYTDMNAQQPAYVILTGVALASAALLLLNTWFRTLWLLGLAGRRLVRPLDPRRRPVPDIRADACRSTRTSSNVERPYLGTTSQATRAAFDLDAIEHAPVHRRAGAHARGLRRRCGDRSTTCGCGTTGRC